MKIDRKLILASASPRRKELLEMLGLDFEIVPSDFDEHEIAKNPDEVAVLNAQGKARDVARKYDDALIVGVDTVVNFKEHILGKPKNREDAFHILNLLNDTTHEVITAICIIDTKNSKEITKVERTSVTIDKLTEEQIVAYVDSGEGVDKAAGYAIQGLGSLFVKEIKGDYFNVVGLPIHLFYKMLSLFDVNIDL